MVAGAADPAEVAGPAGRRPPMRRPRRVHGTVSPASFAAAGGPAVVPGGPGGGGGGGRRGMTPEQQAAQQEQTDKLKAWRTSVSMDAFKKLRKMYNDAGVTIYAWKQLNTSMSDEEYEYIFNVAEALGVHAHDVGACQLMRLRSSDSATSR